MTRPGPAITTMLCITAWTFCVTAVHTAVHADLTPMLVSTTEDGRPTVTPLSEPSQFEGSTSRPALLFFPPAAASSEHWIFIAENTPLREAMTQSSRVALVVARGVSGAAADAIPAQTIQLEQLLAFTVNRALPEYATSVIFSPADGAALLTPCPTLRRLPATDEKTGTQTYPAMTAQIYQNARVLLEIHFAEGQAVLPWADIPALGERFRDGLPPGEYTICGENATKSNRFTVKPAPLREWMESRFAPLEALLGPHDPVTVQIVAETLAQDAVDGPFFTDALDRIDTLPPEEQTSYLKGMTAYLTFRLSGREGSFRGNDGALPGDEEPREKTPAASDPAADAAFIHRLLLNEKWREAAARLDRLEEKLEADHSVNPAASDSRELFALCHLYRGMILAESGAARLQDGYAEFAEATRLLDEIAQTGQPEAKQVADSRYRCANNFGNYLLRLTQDRLYNHAMAIATGDAMVLTDVLFTWSQAMTAYQNALKIASETLSEAPELVLAAKMNIARLYALLGDVVRTVDVEKATVELENSAYDTAAALAAEVISGKIAGEERLLAGAHHLLADIAFRKGDKAQCRQESEHARAAYVQTGTLSGVEAVERLLGMLETDAPESALKHLMISSVLCESLRQQVPGDGIGLSRAGFFARRAYVNERIMTLLLQAGKAAEALVVLEAAKGHALQAVLAGAAVQDDTQDAGAPRTVAEMLVDWPDEIAAVEYFLGSESCWGFLICKGNVSAFPILQPDGKPTPSRTLVAQAQETLTLLRNGLRLMRGGDYSRTWQRGLYDLRRALIPENVLEQIRRDGCEKLLVVPHHILHYLPFSALVVEEDASPEIAKAVAMPRYMLDEEFCIFTAPSLSTWDLLRQCHHQLSPRVTFFGISKFSTLSPLKGIQNDIKNAKSAFGDTAVELFLEEDATVEAFVEQLGYKGLMIVSTHGENVSEAPLESRLFFQAPGSGDASLTAGEIYSLSIGAGLIVLNACQTGLADRSPMPGDDLFGIPRALFQGGAGAVVASNWNVFDRTGPRVVGAMLKHFADGADAVTALSRAQRDFLTEERTTPLGAKNEWLHPYFWAVYSISGSDRLEWPH